MALSPVSQPTQNTDTSSSQPASRLCPSAERLQLLNQISSSSPTTGKIINNYLQLAYAKNHPVVAGIAVMFLGLALSADPRRDIGLDTIYIGFCIATGKQIGIENTVESMNASSEPESEAQKSNFEQAQNFINHYLFGKDYLRKTGDQITTNQYDYEHIDKYFKGKLSEIFVQNKFNCTQTQLENLQQNLLNEATKFVHQSKIALVKHPIFDFFKVPFPTPNDVN
jgi:hypothetical protein